MTLSICDEQKEVIEASGNCIVVAGPGSGKTRTLSEKVKRVLNELPHYKGVIAISFTNKASDELESRSLFGGIDRKSSFFGTIDSFFLCEIIIPFGRHVFGEPCREIKVVEWTNTDTAPEIRRHAQETEGEHVALELVSAMETLYLDGRVVLDTIGCLGMHVLDHSPACRRYLKARYSHVFIDEYQDCGLWQHALFRKLIELGIRGVVVGDINQSIFAFAKKDPKYLVELSHDTSRFRTYALSENHRSHRSIVNYAARLLSATYQPVPINEIHIYEKRIVGSEIEIAQWLSVAVPESGRRFQAERNRVGILVRGARTSNLVHRNLCIPHKSFVTTPLDTDSSLWGSLFRRILNWVFDSNVTKHELVEHYMSMDMQMPTVRKIMPILCQIEEIAVKDSSALETNGELFERVASLILPGAVNSAAIARLQEVLANPTFIDSYVPPKKDEAQLMTFHKAKGLEFDVVFHLDLYRWILPMYKGDEIQDLNLHYVGITRAKQCCILCTSTRRHNDQGELSAEDSPFLQMNNLRELRIPCPI